MSRGAVEKTPNGLDPFSKRVLYGAADEAGVWQRWMALQAQHRDMAAKLWAGMVATEFTDHELSVLDRAAISDHDRVVMVRAGRPMNWGGRE